MISKDVQVTLSTAWVEAVEQVGVLLQFIEISASRASWSLTMT